MKKIIAALYLFAITSSLYSQTGSIEVTSVSQRTDGSGFVDIYFSLNGPIIIYALTVEVSFNGGGSYEIIPSEYLSGHVNGVIPGNNKHIVWDGLGSSPDNFSLQTKLKITANPVGNAPVAAFSANLTGGTAPLTVSFTDQSTNNPTTWLWEFGDGTISIQQNPVKTYQNAGSYNVKLSATNSFGSDTYIKNNYIIVNPAGIAPVGDFTADPTNGYAPLAVNFSDLSANLPTNWLWDFGDGTTSTQQNPSKTYQNAGSYNVVLTASNSYGTNAVTKNNYITVLSGDDPWPPGTVHCSGTPTAIVDVVNPATGKTWMDRNLGASQAATSSADPLAYGDLYQWGRFSDGHQCRNSGTTWTLSSSDTPDHGNFILAPVSPNDWRSPQNFSLWQGVNGINNPCPDGYRIPTQAELDSERQSWISNNVVGAFNSPLKLSFGGDRDNTNGFINWAVSIGRYWSSNINNYHSVRLDFSLNYAYIGSSNRANGHSVRCIKDSAPTQGIINTLDCNTATNNGSLTEGAPASEVSSMVPYTGGNGGTHNGQTVTSTGITGLTATLAAGSFANGDGTITYTITGTPSSSGTASFALNIGGQSCTLNLTVNAFGGDTWPPGTIHCSGIPTAIVDVVNPTTGKTWMDRNLGASQAATSSADPLAYGDLYQWGRFSDGHQCRNSGTTTTLSSSDTPGHGNFIKADGNPKDWRSPQNNNLWQGADGTNNPCPIGYRIPTNAELNAEYSSWNSNNAAGALNSPLKLPAGGARDFQTGSVYSVGSSGNFWSSSVEFTKTRQLYFSSSSAQTGSNYRATGFSVRCIKDATQVLGVINSLNCNASTNIGELTPDTPASEVNSIVPYTGGNGGTHNGQTVTSTGVTGLTATLAAGTFANGDGSLTYTITGTPASSGTASFALNIGGQSCTLNRTVNASSGGTWPPGTVHCSGTPTAIVDVVNPATGKTWMDRNLGASQAATSSVDPLAYGDLYQWGRFSDGHQCRNSGTTSTLSSSDTPGHGNFILVSNSPYDWRSPQNNNLWQGVYGTNNPCPNGYRLPTDAELNTERVSWGSNNATGAFNSPLKLPVAGFRVLVDGSIDYVGFDGFYWSATVDGTSTRRLYFISSDAGVFSSDRAYGFSVRCLKD